jgi:hypothetical protein
LGDFFNTFVSPDIRAYYRIFPFIGFFCVAAAASITSHFARRYSWRGQALLASALIIVGTLDQCVASEAIEDRTQLYEQDRLFLSAVERVLPAGSKVFQLPYTDFPNEVLAGSMYSNDHLRPYIHSTKYRWSWGAPTGTLSAEWCRQSAALPIPEMLDALVAQGFSAVWIDTAGLDAKLATEIAAYSRTAPIQSPDRRFWFVDISLLTGRTGLPGFSVIPERGFYLAEGREGLTWRWALNRARMLVVNTGAAAKVKLSMDLESAEKASPASMTISWPGGKDTVHLPAHYERFLDLSGPGNVPVDFRCDCKDVLPSDGLRTLSFVVANLRME